MFPWCYTEQSALCVYVVDVQFQALFFFFFLNSDYDLLSVLSVGKCMTVVLKNKNKYTIMLQVPIIAM